MNSPWEASISSRPAHLLPQRTDAAGAQPLHWWSTLTPREHLMAAEGLLMEGAAPVGHRSREAA